MHLYIATAKQKQILLQIKEQLIDMLLDNAKAALHEATTANDAKWQEARKTADDIQLIHDYAAVIDAITHYPTSIPLPSHKHPTPVAIMDWWINWAVDYYEDEVYSQREHTSEVIENLVEISMLKAVWDRR